MPKYPHVRDGLHNIKAAYFEVEYEEVFHLKELYKLVYEWMELWNYKSIDKKSSGEPIGEFESLYMELVGNSGAQNHHIWWRMEKTINSYVKYFIRFDFQTLNTTKIEVMHKGKKEKTYKSDIIMRADGFVMLDWKDEWPQHWLLKHLDKWYVTRWYKNEIEQHKKALWFELYNLEDTVKQNLTLNTTFERPEPFHPNKGLA